MYAKSLTETKQNIVKRNFPFIDMFDHTGTSMLRVMRNLTVRVFEHLEITPHSNVYQSIAYLQHILRGSAPKKHKTVLAECKESTNGLYGDQWMFGPTKYVTMEQ